MNSDTSSSHLLRYTDVCPACQKEHCGGVRLRCKHCREITHLNENNEPCWQGECCAANGRSDHEWVVEAHIITQASYQLTTLLQCLFDQSNFLGGSCQGQHGWQLE
jgi:hypothetical protein